LPEYLTRGKKTARIWTVLVVLLMAGAWGFLVISDESIWSTEPNALIALNESINIIEVETVGEHSTDKIESKPATKPSAGQTVSEKNTPATKTPSGQAAAQPISANPPPPPETDVAVTSLLKPEIAPIKVMEKSIKESSASKISPAVPVPNPPAATVPAKPQTPAVVNRQAEGRLTIVASTGVNISSTKDAPGWVTVKDAVKKKAPEGLPFPAGLKSSAVEAPAAWQPRHADPPRPST